MYETEEFPMQKPQKEIKREKKCYRIGIEASHLNFDTQFVQII